MAATIGFPSECKRVIPVLTILPFADPSSLRMGVHKKRDLKNKFETEQY
jgi:hypothetical protein